MTREEAKSCIGTIEMLQRLAYNIHGVMDVIDADNCKKIIKALEQEPTTKNEAKYCDRNICLKNEYNNIGCEDCEVTKSQVPTTKNDLGVEKIVDVLGSYTDLDIPYKHKIAEDILNNLSSVTPQPRKGHWIEQIDHEENCRTLICSNCDRPALHDEDSIWKHKFCPHCGADMREVEE